VLRCYTGSQRQRDELGEELDLATRDLRPPVPFQGAVHQCPRVRLDIVALKRGVRSPAEASPDAFRAESGCSSDISHLNPLLGTRTYSREHSISALRSDQEVVLALLIESAGLRWISLVS
jgi:hypothetical protein